jgi:hypothetical protein
VSFRASNRSHCDWASDSDAQSGSTTIDTNSWGGDGSFLVSTAVIRILVDVVAVQDILLSNEAFDRKERNRQRGEQHNKNQWRHFFAFSPSSTKRRMASERPSSSSCMAAQAPTFARSSSDRRIAVTGSRPVAGRPRPLFGTTLFELGIKCITINAGRGDVLSFRPGSNPNHPE